jgi:hypothetical protein
MRLIKLAVISFVGLFLVIFLLSLLIPSKMRVSRAINIEAPRDSIVKYLVDLREWKKWNVLTNNSQLTGVTYTEKTFVSDQMTISLVGTDSMQVLTHWNRKGQDTVKGGYSLTSAGSTTVVQAFFDFKVKWYPWEKFGSIVFDNEIGPPLEKSLEQLKTVCIDKH